MRGPGGATFDRGLAFAACCFATVFGVSFASPVAARNLALMVAVTRYDEASIRALEGPNNDIILMWRELKRRGFDPADIAVLADDLPDRPDVPAAAASPTRAAIMAQLEALATRAQSGDFVVFQFSGHGSTQPVVDPDAQIEPEPDGRDQVLLPRDAGRYDPASRGIRNGIVDDDLARAIDAIRQKGATVWAIVDACHSGTVTRSGGVTRSVRAAALGVPAEPGPATAALPGRRAGTVAAHNTPGRAPLIGFYAVDSRSEAIERVFPGFAPGLAGRPQDERIGVFTAHLVRALESGKAMTFRDLARVVSSDMVKLQGAASAPLPVFDGDLDRRIGGGAYVPAVRSLATMRDTGIAVAAGALHGFEIGAGLALFDGPLADAKRLGMAHVAEATASTALAQADPGWTPPDPVAELWAEVTEPAVSFAYRIARPRPGEGDAERIDRLIELAKGSGRRGLSVTVVAFDEPSDLRLVVEGGRMWAVPEGQTVQIDVSRPGASVSVDLAMPDNAAATALRRILWAMARAANLVRIASAGSDGGGTDATIETSVSLTRESDAARTADERRACAPLAKPQAGEVLMPAVPAGVGHCDSFEVGLRNIGDRDLDVGVFYLDARAGVALVDERMANNGCVVTLPPAMAEPMRLPSRQFAIWEDSRPLTLGLQRVLIFAMPRTGTQPPNLCHLREASLQIAQRSIGKTRGLTRLLAQAGLSEGPVRGANPSASEGDGDPGASVLQYTFDLREWARP